jgi:hypothetical protein
MECKVLKINELVIKYDGSVVPVQTIEEGDLLMGMDSSPRTVLSTTAGSGPLYRIIPVRGEPWECTEDHRLTLVQSYSGSRAFAGRIVDVPLGDILQRKPMSKFQKDCSYTTYKLFRVLVDFPEIKVKVDPYLVGLWLGDGTRGEAHITTTDTVILDACLVRARHYGTRLRLSSSTGAGAGSALQLAFTTRASDGQAAENYLRRFFRSQCVTSDHQKTIPVQYLRNCESVRLHLLAGLLDTDGDLASNCYSSRTLKVRGGIITQANRYLGGFCSSQRIFPPQIIQVLPSITTKYPQLRDDMLYLCRSLGFAAYASPTVKGIKATGFSGTYYRLSISGDTNRIPCRIAYKQATPRKQVKNVLRTGFAIAPAGTGDFYGFTLDGDGRFLLGDFTVTHHSTPSF